MLYPASFAASTSHDELEDAGLREREEFFRTMIERQTDAISCWLPDTTLIYGNDAFFNLYDKFWGITHEQLIGKPWLSVIEIPEDHARAQEYVASQTAQPRIESNCREFPFPDGALHWILWCDYPIFGDQGRLIGFETVGRDVTELKEAENQLKLYATDLERMNEEVKQFAYIVSHDLRAPLVNMKGFAGELRSAFAVLQSALDTAAPHLNDAQRQAVDIACREDIPEALGFIESSASRMDYFVNTLLRLSRLGRKEMIFEQLDLDAIVSSILQGLAYQIEERGTMVMVKALPRITGDRTSIEQIVGNILTNAVFYLDSDRPGRIEISGKSDGDVTVFTVCDNGRGIAEEDMPKVFAPFRRAGKQDVEGEGMGLAYAQTLAYRHGGHIECTSTPGIGTTFTVRLHNRPHEFRTSNFG